MPPLKSAVTLAEFDRLVSFGETPERSAQRLGVTITTIDRYRHRLNPQTATQEPPMSEDGYVGNRYTNRPPRTTRDSALDVLTTLPAWMDDAACIDATGTDCDPTSENMDDRERAIDELCSTCPVVKDCARRALELDDEYHVHGGIDVTYMHASPRRRALAAVAGVAAPKPAPQPERKRNAQRINWTPAMDCIVRTATKEQAAAELKLSPRVIAYRRAELAKQAA